jgi:hypothetical protein
MLKSAFLALLIAFSSPAFGQAQKGPNGGIVANSQGHAIEFVVKGQEIVFYLSDDDKSPLATKGMRGRAVIQDGGKTATVTLQAAAPNMLVGQLTDALNPKARVVFSTTFRAGSHNHTLTARYVVD